MKQFIIVPCWTGKMPRRFTNNNTVQHLGTVAMLMIRLWSFRAQFPKDGPLNGCIVTDFKMSSIGTLGGIHFIALIKERGTSVKKMRVISFFLTPQPNHNGETPFRRKKALRKRLRADVSLN